MTRRWVIVLDGLAVVAGPFFTRWGAEVVATGMRRDEADYARRAKVAPRAITLGRT